MNQIDSPAQYTANEILEAEERVRSTGAECTWSAERNQFRVEYPAIMRLSDFWAEDPEDAYEEANMRMDAAKARGELR